MIDWRPYYLARAREFSTEPMKIVGKTVRGDPVSESMLDIIGQATNDVLRLKPEEILLELGCGTGLMSKLLAPKVSRLFGVDMVPQFENYFLQALSDTSDNGTFYCGDIRVMSYKPFAEATACFAYEVFQHLSYKEIGVVARKLLRETRVSKAFFGGVLDLSKRAKFESMRENASPEQPDDSPNLSNLGFWHDSGEIAQILTDCGWSVSRLAQPPDLYTSHYRFDIAIERRLHE
jgi:SAM-dependent methyltransferase